jgi:hypothetical protein
MESHLNGNNGAVAPETNLKPRKKDKPTWGLLPRLPLEEVARVMARAAYSKYSPHNWMAGASWQTYFDALQRHAWAWWDGEDRDTDSGRHHLAHVAANALILLWYALVTKGTDDRPHKIMESKDG